MSEYMTKAEAGHPIAKRQEVIDQELARLYETHNNITTDLVIASAEDPESPLHKYFEWNNDRAAHLYRQQQALQMILASKMVVVLQKAENEPPRVVHAEAPTVRQLVNAFRGEGFTMRKDALGDDNKRAAIVAKHRARLRGWCREVVDIEELQPLRTRILEELGD